MLEGRYLDRDFKSEYLAFYAHQFQDFPVSTIRVHFFDTVVRVADVWHLSDRQKAGYLGYVIIRPKVRSAVGRTMLRPPPTLQGAVRTGVVDVVHLFGQRLQVRAVPFMQQDARLGTCSHVGSWMCHYSAVLARRDGVSRRDIAEFSLLAEPSLNVGRPFPSKGLSLHQISELLRLFGLPPLFYTVSHLEDDDRPDDWPDSQTGLHARVTRICCRYANSGLPVLAVVRPYITGRKSNDLHAMVVCGYTRKAEDGTDGPTTLIVNDDRRGPYLRVNNVEREDDPDGGVEYRWEHLLAPMPERLWLPGEAAERFGWDQLLRAARSAQSAVKSAETLLKLQRDGQLTIRTFAIETNRFKRRFARNCSDVAVVEEYMYARMPKYLWVVEAIHKGRRAAGKPSVLAEILFDATSDEERPEVLSLRLPGLLALPRPNDPDWDLQVGDGYTATTGQYDP